LYYTSLSKQIIINPSIENIIKNMKNNKKKAIRDNKKDRKPKSLPARRK